MILIVLFMTLVCARWSLIYFYILTLYFIYFVGNAELLFYKQVQNEEERIMDLRIANFLKQKQEREARNRAEQEAIKVAKQKGIDHIAKAQKVWLFDIENFCFVNLIPYVDYLKAWAWAFFTKECFEIIKKTFLTIFTYRQE